MEPQASERVNARLLLSMSKYNQDLVNPALQIYNVGQSFQYYAMRSYVDKQRKSRKKVYMETRDRRE